MSILESELVLNDDGSIYHLHLLPEDIADTILLVGDQDRVPEVSKYFDSIEVKKHKREFYTHTGFIGKKRISVISTGIGTDNIDIVINELDALANIDLQKREEKKEKKSLKFIRIGTSGSLQKSIEVDSIVASSHGLGLDGTLNFYPMVFTNHELELQAKIATQLDISFVNSYVTQSPGNILSLFPELAKGITATCCGFYAPQGRVLRAGVKVPNLIERLSKVDINGLCVTNFEMETAAIYGLAKLLGHEAVSVNAIVANRITHQFSKQPHKTIDQTILRVLDAVQLS
ncbi:MAG: nucleoside phosphorylase [Bacteroidota bacterium]